MGAAPIELIRRPVVNSNENVVNAPVFGQRYFARASLRILLSDTAADLANLPAVTATAPVALQNLAPIAQAPPHPAACAATQGLSAGKYVLCGTLLSGTASHALLQPNDYYAASGAWLRAGTPLVNGFIKIELQRQDFTWVDVTNEILGLGFTGRRLTATNPPNSAAANFVLPVVHVAGAYYLNDNVFGTAPNAGAAPPCADPSPNAVIRLQRVRDDHSPSVACGIGSPYGFDYVPNVLFDPREGNLRIGQPTNTQTQFNGGLMNYVELDVRNLTRWLVGQIGASGPLAEDSDGGYVVYFSDRRGNQRLNGLETGEYGFEDFINPNDAATGFPNGALDEGEDVNDIDADQNGSHLDTYGAAPHAAVLASARVNATANGVALANSRPWGSATTRESRSNPPLFYRRALKIVRGAGTAVNANVSPLTILPAGRGLTIVAENPVYIEGNYNTGTAGNFGNQQTEHRPSALVADAITLLSNGWNDLRSFTFKEGANVRFGSQDRARRRATASWYRMGVAAGKGGTFLHPDWDSDDDFGSDGGVHNFLRFIEDWGGVNVFYRGSLVSFHINRQAVGIYKVGANTYNPPTRNYTFDTEFLQLTLIPPKSPAFRDINTMEFRQLLRPTQ
jgi:hypothetical protein